MNKGLVKVNKNCTKCERRDVMGAEVGHFQAECTKSDISPQLLTELLRALQKLLFPKLVRNFKGPQ